MSSSRQIFYQPNPSPRWWRKRQAFDDPEIRVVKNLSKSRPFDRVFWGNKYSALSKTHQPDRFLTRLKKNSPQNPVKSTTFWQSFDKLLTNFWRRDFLGRQKLVFFVTSVVTGLAGQKFVDLTTFWQVFRAQDFVCMALLLFYKHKAQKKEITLLFLASLTSSDITLGIFVIIRVILVVTEPPYLTEACRIIFVFGGVICILMSAWCIFLLSWQVRKKTTKWSELSLTNGLSNVLRRDTTLLIFRLGPPIYAKKNPIYQHWAGFAKFTWRFIYNSYRFSCFYVY